jgi:hypothetical protein
MTLVDLRPVLELLAAWHCTCTWAWVEITCLSVDCFESAVRVMFHQDLLCVPCCATCPAGRRSAVMMHACGCELVRQCFATTTN